MRRRGPWRSFDDVQYATLKRVAWFTMRRHIAPLGYLPPAEFEEQYSRAQAAETESSGIS
jgi:hypothetical protein